MIKVSVICDRCGKIGRETEYTNKQGIRAERMDLHIKEQWAKRRAEDICKDCANQQAMPLFHRGTGVAKGEEHEQAHQEEEETKTKRRRVKKNQRVRV